MTDRGHLHLPEPIEPEGPIDPDSRSRLASAVDELAPTADITHPTAFAAAVDRFDRHVDGWFERLRGERWADELFEAASRLGDWSLIWMLLNAAQGLSGPTGPERAVRNTAVLFVESVSVNQGIKSLFNRVRPEADPEVAGRIRRPTTSSFPSGHAERGLHRCRPAHRGAPGPQGARLRPRHRRVEQPHPHPHAPRVRRGGGGRHRHRHRPCRPPLVAGPLTAAGRVTSVRECCSRKRR